MARLNHPGRRGPTNLTRFYKRRGSTSTPPSITDPRDISGLVGWYSAEAVTGLADAAEMTTWADLSGLGNDATGAGIVKPQWKAASGPSGGPAVWFEGGASAGHFTLPTGASFLSTATEGEILAYVKGDVTGSGGPDNSPWAFGTNASGNQSHYPFTGDGNVYEGFGSVAASRQSFTPTLALNAWRRYDVWSAANDFGARLDTVTQATSAAARTVSWSAAPLLGKGQNGGSSENLHHGYFSVVLVYNRKLTDNERALLDDWMVAHPSGGTIPSGLTSVTSSRSTTWNTSASVTSSRATTWNVAAAVTSSRATTWHTLAAATSTRATTWNVRAAVSSTRATTWNVAAQVTSSRATTWHVRAVVSSSRATTWNVRTPVAASTRATTWNVRAAVTSSRATTWNVIGPVTSTRATTWHVRAVVSSTRATTWTVRTPVAASTRATTWNTYASTTSTRATTWHVRAVVTSSRATTWDVAGPSLGPFTITGDLGSLVGADFPTPAPHHVVVRLDLPGGQRDPSLPTATVAADGTFTLANIPLGTYRLSALWRTGILGVPVQAVTLDPLAVTADADLLDLAT